MLRLTCLLFQVLVLLIAVWHNRSLSSSEVLVLSDNDFFSEVTKAEANVKWFVEFFAPWCGHCKRLEPIWKDFAIALKEKDHKDIRLATVDAEANHETAQRFDVKGYPTLLYLVNKNMYKYDGARTVEDMMEFVISGYHSKHAMPLPSPPSFLDLQRMKLFAWLQTQDNSMLAKDFEHILSFRKNAAIVLLIMGGLLGFSLGCIASTLTTSGSPGSTSSNSNKEKPKAD